MVDATAIVLVLVLLGVANGTPIIATKLLGNHLAAPLDGGLQLRDGQPLFGASKTIRGVVLSLPCTALAAWLLGFPWPLGAALAAASLAGDLLSSFLKRRLGMALHAQFLCLDQIPEALLPMLLLHRPLNLAGPDIVAALVAFVLLELLLSRVLFWLKLRDRPY